MDEKIRQWEAELQAWEADLERWHTQEESASGDPQLRIEQQKMLEELHDKRMEARRYLDALARGGNWTELQPKIDALWSDIRTSIAAIKQWA